ncbi:DUF397 domain-containing protein [Actinoallomurus sp. CA-150999]|uniref:DUF397 domain-containing protein n=1 Tax=Actinoallomurus sp. CA-150999 TaxID=3239887 RepID=UPI003D8B1FE3
MSPQADFPAWRKSSHSDANGNCVELNVGWNEFSRSQPQGSEHVPDPVPPPPSH